MPFYRDSGRLKPLFRADGAFDMAGWNDVPILTRNEAKASEDALHARVTPPDMGELAAYSTSGSTGTPLKFRQTLVQRVASEVLINRALRWHDLWPIEAFAMSRGLTSEREPPPGNLIVSTELDFAVQVDMLRRHRTTHALAMPSVAAAGLSRRAEDGLPELKAVLVAGLGSDGRNAGADRARTPRQSPQPLFGKRARPDRRGRPGWPARVNEETVWLEGPRNAAEAHAPVPVVVTPLYAFATPLIRYAPGDYVRFSTATPKRAPGLRRLETVIGRARNLLGCQTVGLSCRRPFAALRWRKCSIIASGNWCKQVSAR